MKPATLFIDIDGTILEHKGGAYDIHQRVLPGVVEAIREVRSLGHCIVLVTARPMTARPVTIDILALHEIPYDALLMGITSGPRIVVNDAKPGGLSANHLVVERDRGFTIDDLLGVINA